MLPTAASLTSLLLYYLVLGIVHADANTDGWSAGKFRQQGEQAMLDGDYTLAVEYLNQAVALDPQNASTYLKLYRVHHRQKQYAEALDDLTKALTIDPTNKDYTQKKIQLLISLGQCTEATDFVNKSQHIGIDVKQAEQAQQCAMEIDLAQKAYFEEDFVTAADMFQRALAHVDLQGSDLMWMKAQSLFRTGDFYGVVSDTGKILKQHKDHLEAYQLRGQAYFRLGEHEQAVLHFREALKLDPEHKGCKEGHKLVKKFEKLRKKGESAFQDRKFKDAIDHWWTAINIDPSHIAFFLPTLLRIVEAHTKLGEHGMAIEECEKHVNYQETVEGLWALGDAQTAGEKYDDAMRSFRRAEEIATDENKRKAQEKIREGEVALKQSKEKNYYKVLGIQRNADTKEIKKAYRELALRCKC
jgi:tetratricopeptide (TPR) repeat protein